MPADKAVYYGDHPLVTEVEQVCRFLSDKSGSHCLKFFVHGCLA